ncbi:MAG: TRAP transporter TatT component family protein [Rhodospirillaceae bacterium]|nr:TRAP transporter TatT component family protein [Rhodospirillaceae bacterium]
MTARFALIPTLIIVMGVTGTVAIAAPAIAPETVAPGSATHAVVAGIEDRWVDIRYVMTDSGERLAAARALRKETAALMANNPANLEFKFWHAMVLLLEAEYKRELGSLRFVREAKRLFEEIEAEDSGLLEGRIHTGLAMLYSGVPGWPIAFGDDGKAEAHFKQALAISPAGQEANYLYADYLLSKKKHAEAIRYFEIALHAPIRADHARAEQFRRKEIEHDLAITRAALKR